MKELTKLFDYNGSPIQFDVIDGQVMMNATLAAKAFGREPIGIFKTKSWKEYESALLEMKPNLRSDDIQYVKQGGVSGEQGTWIHQELALEFSRRLNPKFGIWCNDKIAELLRTGSVSIKPKPTREEKYLKQGKDTKWIEQRVESVGTRKFFTATLKQHGVKNEGYKNCTNAIYIPLYGGTTAVVREKKGLDKNKNIRDNISRSEVAAINLVEQLASERIEKEDAFGNAQCEVICTKASKAVANAIVQARK